MRSRGIFVATFVVASAGATVWACSTTPDLPDASSDAAPDITERKVPPGMDASGDAGDGAITGPLHLADTGLYSDFAARTLTAGIIQYVPRYPLWSDGAEKKRYLLLPPNTQIDTTSMDDWVFPVGTKVWKEFDIVGDDGGTTVVETRLLWKVDSAGDWFKVAYAWTADGSDAVAEPDGGTNALGTTHDIPSQGNCQECHSNVRDGLVGVSAIQLGASDGDGTLGKLATAGLLTTTAATAYDVPGAGATKAALGYLHGNCGQCHNDISVLHTQTPMRLRLLTTDKVPEDTAVYKTATCLVMVHPIPPEGLIYTLVPGHPEVSGIAVRMNRATVRMPPICTKVIDDAGVATVSAWIASMDAAAPCYDASTD